MMLEPAIKKTTEVLEQLAFLPCGFHRHHSVYISQRFIRKLCSERSRCRTTKCRDTPVNSALAALRFDCLLMKSRCFVLSLFFFCSLCVNSLSLKHTETSCCIFQVLQVMMLFPLPPRPCFTRPNLNLSHGPWRWKAWLWAGKEAA